MSPRPGVELVLGAVRDFTMRSTLALAVAFLPLAENACASPADAVHASASEPAPAPEPAANDPRQVLRTASIFSNLDFEAIDAEGNALEWKCGCGAQSVPCRTSSKAVHGSRSLELGTGCYAYQETSTFDATRGVSFDGFTADGAVFPGDVHLFALTKVGDYDDVGVEDIPAATPAWAPLKGQGLVSTEGKAVLQLLLTNSNGAIDAELDGAKPTPPMHVDDLIAVQDRSNPPPKHAVLLEATHKDRFHYEPAASTGKLYLPLPIDWATQTPLYLHLDVSPPSTVERITYASEAGAEGASNWGATITFVPDAPATDATIQWEAVVLTRSISEEERPTLYAATGATDAWLAASPNVDSANPEIAKTAKALVSSTATPLDKMRRVIGWTSQSLGGQGTLTGLDATTVFNTRVASCTGFANLAAAMGRALQVPTRHVTNILVGSSQQMHSIDEFYLGPSLGWRRVEPQAAEPTVPEEYGFIMRLVVPEDEAAVSNRDSIDGSLMSGIPLHEFTETLAGGEHFAYSPSLRANFSDCSLCTDHADRVALLRDADPSAMAQLFDQARTAWRVDLASYEASTTAGVTSPISAARLETRKSALTARSTADVRALVDALR